MDQPELDAILESHRKWLSGEHGGSRAILENDNLMGANLREAVLYI